MVSHSKLIDLIFQLRIYGTYVARKMRQKELQNIDVSATVTLISSIYGSDFDGEAVVVFE